MKQLLFDQPIFTAQTAYLPFALTDIFTERVADEAAQMIHFWQCEDTFILGMKDTRVPEFERGLAAVVENHYFPVVRNSGGLGVIADAGVLNLSLIFPKSDDMTTDRAYEKMLAVTRLAFPELAIEADEITASYCPGTFDLSVAGQKIAGLAQRRIKNGIAVMMYLSVNGDQTARGQAVRAFYQASLGAAFGTNGYPAVEPDCMTTVSSLLGQPLSIADTKQRFQQALQITAPAVDTLTWINETAQTELLAKKTASMQQRNLQVKENLDGRTL